MFFLFCFSWLFCSDDLSADLGLSLSQESFDDVDS